MGLSCPWKHSTTEEGSVLMLSWKPQRANSW